MEPQYNGHWTKQKPHYYSHLVKVARDVIGGCVIWGSTVIDTICNNEPEGDKDYLTIFNLINIYSISILTFKTHLFQVLLVEKNEEIANFDGKCEYLILIGLIEQNQIKCIKEVCKTDV